MWIFTVPAEVDITATSSIYLSLLQELHKTLGRKMTVELKAEPSKGHKPDKVNQQEVMSEQPDVDQP